MSMSPALQKLLAQIVPGTQLEFDRLQEALLQVRFTGPVTYDYLNGVPQQINLGPPIRLSICRGERPTGLDTGKGSKQS